MLRTCAWQVGPEVKLLAPPNVVLPTVPLKLGLSGLANGVKPFPCTALAVAEEGRDARRGRADDGFVAVELRVL